MKERPILFNAAMVNAILEGRKTMTRRVINPQPTHFHYFDNGQEPCDIKGNSTKCPYGQAGSKLWVRETWAASRLFDLMPPRLIPKKADLFYKADGGDNWNQCARVRQSIFMPRHFSRTTLEVIKIRVEQIQDITDSDAIQEGVDRTNTSIPGYAIQRFKTLWDSINEKRGYGWDINPWVWVVEFKTV